ncbi:MAG: hypothetical protein AVDCRST_MAG20-1132, partial [uncultured Acidimicrobiales bacterium]
CSRRPRRTGASRASMGSRPTAEVGARARRPRLASPPGHGDTSISPHLPRPGTGRWPAR